MTKMTETAKLKFDKRGELIRFEVVSTVLTIEDLTAETYGIQRGELRYDDISTDKSQVKRLVRFLNKKEPISDDKVWDWILYFIEEIDI
jgi:hypothetical protein